jgi:hypothetical protein
VLRTVPLALSYSIDVRRCRVTVTATAQPTFDEWVQVHTAFLRDPAFKRGFDLLWDRRAYRTAPDRGYIEQVMTWWREHQATIGDGRVATVVPDDTPAAYGMARMAEILGRSESSLRAFHDIDQAVQWLDERFEPDAVGDGERHPGRRD